MTTRGRGRSGRDRQIGQQSEVHDDFRSDDKIGQPKARDRGRRAAENTGASNSGEIDLSVDTCSVSNVGGTGIPVAFSAQSTTSNAKPDRRSTTQLKRASSDMHPHSSGQPNMGFAMNQRENQGVPLVRTQSWAGKSSKTEANGGNVQGNETDKSSVKYKTKICIFWLQPGGCPYGNECFFAHGAHELRFENYATCPGPSPATNSKYKTRLCRHWVSSDGKYCPHGIRCVFAHGESEMRKDTPVSSTRSRQNLPLEEAVSTTSKQSTATPRQTGKGVTEAPHEETNELDHSSQTRNASTTEESNTAYWQPVNEPPGKNHGKAKSLRQHAAALAPLLRDAAEAALAAASNPALSSSEQARATETANASMHLVYLAMQDPSAFLNHVATLQDSPAYQAALQLDSNRAALEKASMLAREALAGNGNIREVTDSEISSRVEWPYYSDVNRHVFPEPNGSLYSSANAPSDKQASAVAADRVIADDEDANRMLRDIFSSLQLSEEEISASCSNSAATSMSRSNLWQWDGPTGSSTATGSTTTSNLRPNTLPGRLNFEPTSELSSGSLMIQSPLTTGLSPFTTEFQPFTPLAYQPQEFGDFQHNNNEHQQ